jgi:uncharacterized membrane protein
MNQTVSRSAREAMMRLALTAALAFGAVCSVSADTYTVSTIDVPGADQTQAYGINDSGQIVGLFYDATGFHGFLKDGDAFVVIDVPGGFTEAFGINRKGRIVGSNGSAGFLKKGDHVTFITVPGSFFTTAWGINDKDQIVGTFADGTGTHGFLRAGTFASIDSPGALFTEATGINKAGLIVGNAYDADGFHGFLLTEGDFTRVEVPDSTVTEAHGINSFGQVAGTFLDTSYVAHGFVSDGSTFARVDVPGASGPNYTHGSCRPSGGKAWPITIRREHSTRSSAPQRAAGLPIHPSCGA